MAGTQHFNIIERAYQLASSGEFTSTAEVKKRLKAEGYTSIDLHFSGSSLQKSLLRLCNSARIAAESAASKTN